MCFFPPFREVRDRVSVYETNCLQIFEPINLKRNRIQKILVNAVHFLVIL